MKTKSNIFNWILFDVANSIISVVFFLYFAQWVVIDKGISDFYFNLTFTISAILLVFTVPLVGALLDTKLRRITGLRYSTILVTITYGLCAIFALAGKEISSLAAFTLGSYFYLLSFTFYNPLLKDIVSEKRRGWISGIGIAFYYLGKGLGLLIVLPIAKGTFSFFNLNPRAETLLPSVIIYLILCLPMLFFFKEPHKKIQKIRIKQEFLNIIKNAKIIFTFASLGFFLLSFFLFNDAILTAANNLPIFLEQVWHLSDTTKTYIALGIILTSMIGGFFSGMIADKYGHRRTLKYILIGWLFIFPFIAITNNFNMLVLATILMGFFYGAIWTVSRSLMAYLAPANKNNLAFGYFGLAERASSILGSLVWGLVATGFTFLGPLRYRLAALSMVLFIIFAIWAFSKVRDERITLKNP